MSDEGIMEIDIKAKEITLEKWRKKASKMNLRYKNIADIEKDADKKIRNEYFYVTSIPKVNVIVVYPFSVIEGGKDDDRIHLSRDALFYFKSEKGKYKKMNTKKFIDELTEKLYTYVDVKELIRDTLYDTNPQDLRELYERAIENKGKIKDAPGCYKLKIGGKRGAPFELMLRD